VDVSDKRLADDTSADADPLDIAAGAFLLRLRAERRWWRLVTDAVVVEAVAESAQSLDVIGAKRT